MLTLTRDTKRLTIITVYCLVFLVIGVGLYLVFKPKPTCFDGKQNQNERGIDCGGICTMVCMEKIVGNDLLVREITFIPGDRGHYDVVARIFNPNNDIGAASFRYALFLRDDSGEELVRVTGENFILPQETKTLLAFNLEPQQVPAKAVIELSDFEWTRLREYRAKPELNIYSKRYVGKPDPAVFGAVIGTLVNESIYDFRKIQIKVVLRDAAGLPLAANQSDMQTVNVGREQDIRIVFPQPFAGTVAQVDIEAEANIYDQDNFLQRYEIPKETSGPGNSFEAPAL
ncbi:MAG: hypothetical protein WAT81_02710 [Candidatus Moraniibacteriota bacterium]